MNVGKTLTACLISLIAVGIISINSQAQDYTIKSDTYLFLFERDNPGGGNLNFAPLYEYLSGTASNISDRPLSFHFDGWIKLDLGDDTGIDGKAGDLGSAFLRYIHPTGNGEARLGRFFLAEGAAADIMDGIFLKATSTLKFGGSIFAGVPVENSITATDTGDSLYGGRIFYAFPGFTELGMSYLRENGDFQGKDREELGFDLWVSSKGPFNLMGNAIYNIATSGLGYQNYVVKAFLIEKVDLFAGYENYKYKDYFQTSLNSAFLPPSVDSGDEVQDLYLGADWTPMEFLVLTIKLENIQHKSAAAGDANRFEIGGNYKYGENRGLLGITTAFVDADRDENSYVELRGYVTYRLDKLYLTLDALTDMNDTAINGVKDSYQVVGAAAYNLRQNLKLTSDVQYTRSPRFKEDYQVLFKATWNFARESGE